MTGFWIYVGMQLEKASEYSRILSMSGFCIMQVSHKVLNMPEYGWIMSYGRILNMPVQNLQGFKKASGSKYARAQNMARLWIWKAYIGCWICLNLPEYALIMSQYVWICFNNAEYD